MTRIFSPKLSLLSLLAACTLSGCLTVGNNFPEKPVGKIERGVSTEKDVRALFGDPFRTGVDNGFKSWTYSYNKWSAFGPTRTKDLYVVYNQDGTVRAYTFNTNF